MEGHRREGPMVGRLLGETDPKRQKIHQETVGRTSLNYDELNTLVVTCHRVSGGYGGQTCFELFRNFIKFFAVSFVLCELILSQAFEECSSALQG